MRHALAILFVLPACLPPLEVADPPSEPLPSPPADVMVVVRDAGVPVAGVTVLFQAADDRVIAEAVTDAVGHAIAALPTGGNVTVIRGTAIVTYTGVKPGDVLDLARPTAATGAPTGVTLTLPPNATFQVITPCGGGTGTGQLELTLTGCGAETDFYGVDVNDPDRAAFLVHAAIGPAIDLSHEPVLGQLETSLIARNPPDGVAIALSKRLVVHGFEVFRSPEIPTQTTTRVPAVGMPAAVQLVLARVVRSDGSTQVIARRAPYENSPGTLDLAATQIPFVHGAVFDGSTVTWIEDGIGTANITIVTLAGAVTTRTIAAAHAGASLHVPKLPPVYAALEVDATAQITATIAQLAGGYDTIRAHGTSPFEAAPLDSQLAVAATP